MTRNRDEKHAARLRWALLPALAALGAAPAVAQPMQQPGQGPGQGMGQGPGQGQPQAPANPADQVVGLFGTTCLHFAGNTGAMRAFLTQQGAPVMPPQARDAFLAGRKGQAYDVSVPGVNLALVSLDDGGCEAVVEKASRTEVLSTLQQAAREAGVPLTPLGAQADGPNGVQHSAFQLTAGGKQMHVLLSTAPAPPQAVLTFAPR
jgi:hypothetical protein